MYAGVREWLPGWNWLTGLHENDINGILDKKVGLGNTLQNSKLKKFVEDVIKFKMLNSTVLMMKRMRGSNFLKMS
ncbi:hypothetical protein MLD38_023557 [Melastoma candidum]|uniref:Uncharacterized protein n=1 Tax=Melastoma candidum TaxID=119954 RepID=A0ACB9NQX6_9MYRT|nr:hypothetical protein MLD38_023557 [Melastoma candidum]